MDRLLHHPAAGDRPIEVRASAEAATRSRSGSPELRLVQGPCLTLVRPSPGATPDQWHEAIVRLGRWLDLDLAQIPRRQASGLQRVTSWAAAAASGREGGAGADPVFAPWTYWSPVSLQQGGASALPQGHWVSSYLYDGTSGRPRRRGAVDIQLLSPLAAACLPGEDAGGPIPKLDVLRAMIGAAASEGRERTVIVTDARRHNAMIRQLLLLDRSMTRDTGQIEVLSVEDALCALVRDRSRWDAIIVLPELRSLIFAMLAQLHAVSSAWPMLWHQRGVTMICAEQLDGGAGDLAFDAPLLVQALALAARQAGLSVIAQRLVQGAARLWDCGIVTPGRGSVAPYVTEVSDDEFVELLCRSVAGGRRTVANWRAVGACLEPAARLGRTQLRLVEKG